MMFVVCANDDLQERFPGGTRPSTGDERAEQDGHDEGRIGGKRISEKNKVHTTDDVGRCNMVTGAYGQCNG
jgi:hypothetical protein